MRITVGHAIVIIMIVACAVYAAAISIAFPGYLYIPSSPWWSHLWTTYIFLVTWVVLGITALVARFAPKEKREVPVKKSTGASNPGGEEKRARVWITSREAGVIAAFGAVGFAWNALGLIVVFFPPASWTLSNPLAYIGAIATGPFGGIILGLTSALMLYSMLADILDWIFTINFPAMLAYWAIKDVIKPIRYPLLFIQSFFIMQEDVWAWSIWMAFPFKLFPPETLWSFNLIPIVPWSLLNAIIITVIVALVDQFAPGLLRPTWFDRYIGKA